MLDGVKSACPAGSLADRVLVPARDRRRRRSSSRSSTRRASGVTRERQDTTNRHPEARLDARRRAGRRRRRARRRRRRRGDRSSGSSSGRPPRCARSRSACARRRVRMTAEYTKTREQFDRPIATFQAVGQRAADAYIDTEAIRLTAWQAVVAARRGPARGDRGRGRQVLGGRGRPARRARRAAPARRHRRRPRLPAAPLLPVGEAARAHARRRDAAAAQARRASSPPSRLRSEQPTHRARSRSSTTACASPRSTGAATASRSLLLHPNGFCAGFFDPLARRLRDTFRPIGVDLRGHGGSDTADVARRLRVRRAWPPTCSRCSTTSAIDAVRRARRVARRRRRRRSSTELRPGLLPRAAALRGDRVRRASAVAGRPT